MLVDDVVRKKFSQLNFSGEFDALSYAFFRSAFEFIAQHIEAYDLPLAQSRRQFTKRVGSTFFDSLHDHLELDLPSELETGEQFAALQENIRQVGDFLQTQGYLRDNFLFRFDVQVVHEGRRISQTSDGFLGELEKTNITYTLYEMGYPVIFPSAVYLYHTIGEAQHNSSRTIEELFNQVGYEDRETDDFDPTEFPPDRVAELWEIIPSFTNKEQTMRPRIHHVSIPRPPGNGARRQMRAYYGELLGLEEIQVPKSLDQRGLEWYQVGDTELHIFVEESVDGSPGRHFCIEVDDVAGTRAQLVAAGFTPRDTTSIPGRPRFFCCDPFDNLIEFTTIEGNYLEGR